MHNGQRTVAVLMAVAVAAISCGCLPIAPHEYLDRAMEKLSIAGGLPEHKVDQSWQPQFNVDTNSYWPESFTTLLGIKWVTFIDDAWSFNVSAAYAYPMRCDYGESEFEIFVHAQRGLPFPRDGIALVRVSQPPEKWSLIGWGGSERALKGKARSPAIRAWIDGSD